MKLLFIIIYGVMFLMGIHSFRSFSIPRIFSFFWSIQCLSCLLLFPDIQWGYYGLLWIALSCIAFNIGYIVVPVTVKQNNSYTVIYKPYGVNYNYVRKVILFVVFVGLIYFVYLVLKKGFSLSAFFSLESLLAMNSSIAQEDALSDGGGNSIDSIFLIFVYLAPMLGGYYVGRSQNWKDKCLCFSTFLPVLLVMLTNNKKAPFVSSVIFFVAAYLVANFRNTHKELKLKRKTVFRIVLVIVLLAFLLAFVMMLRIGTIDDRVVQIVSSKFLDYLFGHIVAFDFWLTDTWNTIVSQFDFSLGTMTFMGISKYLGYERVDGIYQDVYGCAELSSNVFSYYRGLIMDYGLLGTLIFMFFVGLITRVAVEYIKWNKKGKAVYDTILLIVLSFCFYYMVSVFSYTSNICAFIAFYISLHFINRKSCSLK